MADKLIADLIALNQRQAAEFVDPGQAAQRRRYLALHPTRITVMKCMDGRVNMALLTRTPVGIIFPLRNIGGIFDLGWPALETRLTQFVDDSIRSGVQNIMMVTYHFSAGSKERGCRGHNYDAERSKQLTQQLVEQIEFVFGRGHEQVYPIMVGVETDTDTLILHGRSGEIVTVSQLDEQQSISAVVQQLYPDMSTAMRADLAPLIQGNQQHVQATAAAARPPLQLEHREQVIAIGQGFDWLHQTNYALIINDVDPRLAESIGNAAGIIKDNLTAKRITNTGAVLFVSVSYHEPGHHRTGAIVRAQYLHRLAMHAIQSSHPELTNFFHSLTAVMAWNTRLLELVDGESLM